MDRRDRLRQLYEQVFAAGEELLKVLREPVTPVVVDQVEALVNRRAAAVDEVVRLFSPGDEVLFGDQLQELQRQQRTLEAEMRRFMDDLAGVSQAAAKARAAVRGVRQMMHSGRGRMLDFKR